MSIETIIHIVIAVLMMAPGLAEFAWIVIGWTFRG